jgi:hypothetical protein
MHNENLYSLHTLHEIYEAKLDWTRRWDVKQGLVQNFGEETLGKRLLQRPRRRLDDNIKTDLKEVSCKWNWFRIV